jgi:flagellar biosynthesis protein FliQ
VYSKVTVQVAPTHTSLAEAVVGMRVAVTKATLAIADLNLYFMPTKVKLPANSCRELSTAPEKAVFS